MSDWILETKGVQKTFGGVKALQDITFHIQRGEILGVIGPNGAGKTTAINVITGVIAPDAGEIFYESKPVTKSRLFLSSRMGMARTFQHPQTLNSLDCLDNVKVACLTRGMSHKEAEQKAEEILDLVGLHSFLHEPSSSLNFAQRKVLDMARALGTQPKLLFLDEVLTGLTDEEIQDLVKKIRSLKNQGLTIVIIEHLVKVIRSVSDRLLVLDTGKVLMQDLPDVVLSNPLVIESYIGKGGVAQNA
ncbi:ABC transporter ATP-binding protein [Fodinisporobacter ferrooxydans]|uniref:ABC transporter ATP-binding protein n=1 Tax=Fodinisporobacter ferrooxydans TaxID=2901836 RepID=A0ABY4CP30_9BACL|nr:ABC transporter ATP-binding protein [Alicyclobacillaceae bacterium MYW30-H2]